MLSLRRIGVALIDRPCLVNKPERQEKWGKSMPSSGTAPGRGWLRDITSYQWRVLLLAWFGWALDNTDFNLFALVLHPALTDLLGGNPSVAAVGRVGGLLSMVGLLGWALGGMCFGVVGDYIGRIRTLALSVVLVAIFTALQGLSPNTVVFGICRFCAGVGTGRNSSSVSRWSPRLSPICRALGCWGS